MGGLQSRLEAAVGDRVKFTNNRDHWQAKRRKIEDDIKQSETIETELEEDYREWKKRLKNTAKRSRRLIL